MDPRLCPADLLLLQRTLSVGPHSDPQPSHARMHDKNLSPVPRASRGPARNPRPLYVAQPCSYASKQERRESFFALSPLSFLGCRYAMHASCCPTVLGAVSLPRWNVVHATPDVLPARRRRRRREWPTSLSRRAASIARAIAGRPVLPGTDSLSCTQRTQRHCDTCTTSLTSIWESQSPRLQLLAAWK